MCTHKNLAAAEVLVGRLILIRCGDCGKLVYKQVPGQAPTIDLIPE